MTNFTMYKKLLENYQKLIDAETCVDSKRKLIKYKFALRCYIGKSGGFSNSVSIFDGHWKNQYSFQATKN